MSFSNAYLLRASISLVLLSLLASLKTLIHQTNIITRSSSASIFEAFDAAYQQAAPAAATNRKTMTTVPGTTENAGLVKQAQDDDDDDEIMDLDNDEPTSHQYSRQAWQFLSSRREAYRKERTGKHRRAWRFRGLGYMFTQHDRMMVYAQAPAATQPGLNVVKILHAKSAKRRQVRKDCHLWTFWVRVMGPELFAGSAMAFSGSVDEDCYWEFAYELQVPGEYHIDAKMLLWNGQRPVTQSNCQITTSENSNDAPEVVAKNITQRYPYHYAFVGFKFYTPYLGCCEACARTPGCRYWMSPPISIDARFRGCELFFDKKPRHFSRFAQLSQNETGYVPPADESLVDLAHVMQPSKRMDREVTFGHGPPHSDQPAAYFCGCGWSFWLTQNYACLDTNLDDMIPVYPTATLTLTEAQKSATDPTQLPLCTSRDEKTINRLVPHHPSTASLAHPSLSTGRWVRQPWPDATTCPLQFAHDTKLSKKLPMTTQDPRRPSCWFREDLREAGARCMEFCARDSHTPWKSRMLESNASSLWYGQWENYGCRYREFTNAELQTCINRRKIRAVTISGASVASFLRQYVEQRLQHIVLWNEFDEEEGDVATGRGQEINKKDKKQSGLEIFVNTVAAPHILWKRSTAEFEHWLQTKHKKVKASSEKNRQEGYYVTASYYSSEREPYTHVARSEQLNPILSAVMTRKGYKRLEAFDLTSAFTFDTATQMDGLHVVGPPMKMLVTKLFHHVCAQTLLADESATNAAL